MDGFKPYFNYIKSKFHVKDNSKLRINAKVALARILSCIKYHICCDRQILFTILWSNI